MQLGKDIRILDSFPDHTIESILPKYLIGKTFSLHIHTVPQTPEPLPQHTEIVFCLLNVEPQATTLGTLVLLGVFAVDTL